MISTTNCNVDISHESSILHEGEMYSAFQCNTIHARVTIGEHEIIVVFPRGWLSIRPSREENLAIAMFGAGVAAARGKRSILVDDWGLDASAA